MSRKILLVLTIVAATALVMTVSAGTIGTSGSTGSAGVTGNGFAVASMDWDAEYAAGWDLVGQADGPGDHFSTSMSGTDTQGNDDITVMVKASQMKVSGSVCGPEEGNGTAFAIASIRALANREVDMSALDDGDEITIETWIFANTHTYADDGVTSTASATASGTATGFGESTYGTAGATSKGTATASSTAKGCGDDSGSAAAGIIYAAARAAEDGLYAGYPDYEYTPLYDFHPIDIPLDPYLYPGNGLIAISLLEGTGSAKSSASGSATAFADMPTDALYAASGSGKGYEHNVMTSSSGTVKSDASGTDSENGAVSGINAWAFALNDVGLGSLQDEFIPGGVIDAGSTIYTAGGVEHDIDTSSIMSTTKKSTTVDSVSMSASGKSSADVNLNSVFDEESVLIDGAIVDLDADTSGSISSGATQDGGEGASGTVNVIAARALGYPIPDFCWGILLPSTVELNTIGWDLFATEGALYSLVGSGSGSVAGDGIGTTSASVSGAADASGSRIDLLPVWDEIPSLPEVIPGPSGETCAKGSIGSKTSAVYDGESATTSQIMALTGGRLQGDATIDFYGPDETISFDTEVGGLTYLTTMDYAASEGLAPWSTTSTTSKKNSCPITSATSTVKGQAAFEGSSVLSSETVEADVGTQQYEVSVEDHEASGSSSGTVTGSTSAIMGEADTGSLIFSASAAELYPVEEGLGIEQIDDAVVDYSLIFSDSSAESVTPVYNTAKASGSADGSTMANSFLDYWTYEEMADPEPVDIYFWEQLTESTTTAKGKITTKAEACGNSTANSLGELKSYNAVQPANVEVITPTEPPELDIAITGPSIINDDSVLASAAQVMGGDCSSDKANAATTVSGSTSSEGEDEFTFQELIQPLVMVTSKNSKTCKPVWEELYGFEVEGATSVSNADSTTAKGSGSNGQFVAWADTYACADQMTTFNVDITKTALAQGIFGVEVANQYPGSDVTVEAKMSNVKVFAYADPVPLTPIAVAKVNYNGGKASAKITPTTATAPPATYSSLTLCVEPPYPVGGTDAYGLNSANFGVGDAYAFQAAIADSNNPTPTAGNPPGFPDILNPVVFWS
jgi:hypothetical protein